MAESGSKKMHQSGMAQPDNNEIDLRHVVDLVKHSYKIVIAITLCFLIMGIYYAETRPPVYQSSAMVEIQSDNMSGVISGAGSALANLTSQQASPADVEMVLLRSPYVLGQVVKQLGLDISVSPLHTGYFERKAAEKKHIQNNAQISVLDVPNALLAKPFIMQVGKNNQFSLYTNQKQKIAEGRVGQPISVPFENGTFNILVSKIQAAPGSEFTIVKQPAERVAEGLSQSLAIREEGESTGVLSLSYYAGDPTQAQTLLNAILDVAVSQNMQEKSEEARKELDFITHQLPFSKDKLLKSEVNLGSYSAKTDIFDAKGAAGMVVGDIQRLKESLDKIRFEKAVLLEKDTSLYPPVVALTDKENRIKQEIKQYQAALDKMPPELAQETNLQTQTKLETKVYTKLVEDVQKMEMLQASMVSSVHVLNKASYPVARVPVKKREIIFGSIILGFVFSLACIFIRHILSPVIEDPDVVERKIGTPVVAIIPCSEKQAAHNRKIKQDKLYAANNPFLLARISPNDVAIEGVRSLRTTIQMALLETENNVLAITGCSPGVGKSFISGNLAAVLSDLGKRVVIIDSDMRLGKLFQTYGKAKAPGLSTYLQKQATLSEILQPVIPGKLDFISTGLYPENPSELLAQQTFNDLVETLKKEYDLVVIDTPPILAVTDAALILKFSAVNLMVLGVGKDQMKEVIHAKSILERGGVTLTGIVFNTLKQKKSGFGYNYGYANYHYTYGNK